MIIEHFLSWMQTASVPKRAQAVGALARAYLYSDMSYDNQVTAESAMTVLLEDPSSCVRFALAEAIASSPKAPRHLIMALADDAFEISVLILARSPVLSTGELVDMIASGTVEQQIAIACRGRMSSAICGAIGEVGVVEACLGLLMNKAASPSKRVLLRIAQRHGTNVEIRKLMLGNDDLDPEIRMLLIEKLGAKLENFVASKKWLSKPRAKKSIRDALDASSILCAAKSDDGQVEQLVEALIDSERLTTSYLLRAICMGNITLFCKALSKLSQIPGERIEAMISQKRHSAFRAAFLKGGMPVEAFEVFSSALNVWQELLSEPEWTSRARMPYLVTRQLLGKYKSSENEVVDELLMLLRRISYDLARDEAHSHVSQLVSKRAREEEQAQIAETQALKAVAVDQNFNSEPVKQITLATNDEIDSDSAGQSVELGAVEVAAIEVAASELESSAGLDLAQLEAEILGGEELVIEELVVEEMVAEETVSVQLVAEESITEESVSEQVDIDAFEDLFAHEMETAMADQLERDIHEVEEVIEISEQDMRLPEKAANDRGDQLADRIAQAQKNFTRDEEYLKSVAEMEASFLSNAA